MGLRLKFNLILIAIFMGGLATIAVVAHRYLEAQALDDATRAAATVLDASSFGNLDPRIATGIGSRLVEMKIREYGINDVITGLEGVVVNKLKAARGNQVADVITLPSGDRRLAVARIVRDGAGGAERVRLANVDLGIVLANVRIALTALMSSIGAVFLAVFIVLNIMLDRMIVRPVAEMARQAEAVSVGDFSIPEFVPASKDEVGVLGTAFNRMRRSTEEAIKLLKGAKF
jgi:HAMP domain-containing protein